MRDVAFVAPGYVVPGAVSLALVPLLFATLGASEFGLWALMYAVASGVPPLTTSAVEALTLRYAHRAKGAIVREHWLVSLAATAGLGALLAVGLIPVRSTAVVSVSVILAVAIGAYLLSMAHLQSAMRFAAASLAASVRAVVGGALTIAAAVAVGTAVTAAVGMSVGFLVAIGLTSVHWSRSRPSADGVGRHDAEPSGRLSYGSASLIIAVGLFVLAVGDRFILSFYRPLADVGVYAAVYNLLDLAIRLGPSIVLVAIRPRLFRAWDAQEPDGVRGWYGGVSAILFWASSSIGVGIVILSQVIVDDVAVRELVGPVAFGLSASIVATSVSLLYSASERQPRLAVNVAVCALLNLGLNFLWVPDHGAVGAAAATVLAFGALLAIHALGIGPSLIRSFESRILSIASVAAGVLMSVGSMATSAPALIASAMIVAATAVPAWQLIRVTIGSTPEPPRAR